MIQEENEIVRLTLSVKIANVVLLGDFIKF